MLGPHRLRGHTSRSGAVRQVAVIFVQSLSPCCEFTPVRNVQLRSFPDEADRVGVREVGVGALRRICHPDLDLFALPGDLQREFAFRPGDRLVAAHVTTSRQPRDFHLRHRGFDLLAL